jgi:hypothetical protein
VGQNMSGARVVHKALAKKRCRMPIWHQCHCDASVPLKYLSHRHGPYTGPSAFEPAGYFTFSGIDGGFFKVRYSGRGIELPPVRRQKWGRKG